MAFHELATNALKHGALSNDTGTIHVSWTVDAERSVRIVWREGAGPIVVEPAKSGFGTLVLERSCLQLLGSAASLNFHAEGLVWQLQVPLASLTGTPSG
jgi:two-component sensor histidine kinase